MILLNYEFDWFQASRKKISGWGDNDQDSSFPLNDKHQGPEFLSSGIKLERDVAQITVQPRLLKGSKRTRHSLVSREFSVDNEEVGTLDGESDGAEDDD
jgi:hypothetical protein